MEEEQQRRDGWIKNIGRELENAYQTFPRERLLEAWSICKIPGELRSVNEDAYTPHVVSIGPFHHGVEKLKLMEQHKPLFLRFLFERTEKPEETLKDCCNNILTLAVAVDVSYAEGVDLDKDEFAKILLYDAGFMLELFIQYSGKAYKFHGTPFDITPWTMAKLKRDLALLENQIHWTVLDCMFDIIKSHGGADGLPGLQTLVCHFFRSALNIKGEISCENYKSPYHLLHLLHSVICSSLPSNLKWKDDNISKEEFMPCATSLGQAGVLFQENRTDELFGLKFESSGTFFFERGTFEIPQLIIEENTESFFRNLAAFEQFQPYIRQYVTSYFTLMDKLIDTAEDVELLQRKGILRSYLGRADDVSNLFNNFRKQLVVKEFHYAVLCEEVNVYANSPWHRFIAALRREVANSPWKRYITVLRHYFKNPWSITSFVVAVILLLLLTFLQTVSSHYHRG